METILECIGKDSVYQFFLTKSLMKWMISLSVTALQLGVLYLFYEGAQTNDFESDTVYPLRCPSFLSGCLDDKQVESFGYFVWFFITFVYLGSDFVKGIYLIFLAGVMGNVRCFIAGFVLSGVTFSSICVSGFYNSAVALQNRDLLINSLVLLFINDMDEQCYDLVTFFIAEVEEPEGEDGMQRQSSLGSVTNF